jgi:hypothetical protein
MGALGKNGHGDRKIIIFSISKGRGSVNRGVAFWIFGG